MRQLLVKLEVETTNINTISSPCASVTDDFCCFVFFVSNALAVYEFFF